MLQGFHLCQCLCSKDFINCNELLCVTWAINCDVKEIYVFVTHLQGISWSRVFQAFAACDIFKSNCECNGQIWCIARILSHIEKDWPS